MPRFFLAAGPLALGALLLSGPVLAQGPAPTGAAPADTPSAFEGYRRFDAQTVAPWRESNDTVGRIGGWKVYAREAQQPDAAPSQPAARTGPSPAPVAPAAPAAGGAARGHAH
jgi:hypothetical protein